MKKETSLTIQVYQERLNESMRKGTKINTALKALKEVENLDEHIERTLISLTARLEHHNRVVRNALHNIAVVESREEI